MSGDRTSRSGHEGFHLRAGESPAGLAGQKCQIGRSDLQRSRRRAVALAARAVARRAVEGKGVAPGYRVDDERRRRLRRSLISYYRPRRRDPQRDSKCERYAHDDTFANFLPDSWTLADACYCDLTTTLAAEIQHCRLPVAESSARLGRDEADLRLYIPIRVVPTAPRLRLFTPRENPMSPAEHPVGLFQSILCPVDFSTQSRVALQHAVAIGQRTGGHLTAMYADDPMLAAAAAVKYNHRLLTKQTTSELRRLLTRAGVPVDRDPQAAGIVSAIGRPAREILNVARRLGTDLIVMGTQGRGGPGRMFLGSVTEQVLRRTPVAVLAVPPGVSARGLKSWPGRQILCAVEFSPRDCQDVRSAAEIARVFDTDLTLVHVVTPTAGLPWLAKKLRAHDRAGLKTARARLEELARCARTVLDARVESRALLGHPAEEIAATSTDIGAGLIVLALRRGHGLFGPRQGSITYRVLSGAATPILALRQGRRPRKALRTRTPTRNVQS